MKTKTFSYILLLLVLACDFPEHYFTEPPVCIQQEMLSDFSNSNTPQYQKLAIEELKGKTPKEFRYFFKTFLEENQKIFMLTNFRNENNCFDVKLRVEKLGKLTGMHRANGKSYPKELYDLKWVKRDIQGTTEIVYIDMHDIID